MKVWILEHRNFEPQVYKKENLQQALSDMQWEYSKDLEYSEHTEGYYFIDDWATLRLVEVIE